MNVNIERLTKTKRKIGKTTKFAKNKMIKEGINNK